MGQDQLSCPDFIEQFDQVMMHQWLIFLFRSSITQDDASAKAKEGLNRDSIEFILQ